MDESHRRTLPGVTYLDDGTTVTLGADDKTLTCWRPLYPGANSVAESEVIGVCELVDDPDASYPWWAEAWLAEWKPEGRDA